MCDSFIIQGSNVPITVNLGAGNGAGLKQFYAALFNCMGGPALKEWDFTGGISDIVTLSLSQEETANLPGKIVLKMKGMAVNDRVIFYKDSFFDVIKREDSGKMLKGGA